MHAEACLGLPVLPVKQTGHLNVPPIPSKLCSIRWHRSFAGESNIWLHSLHSWLMPSSARFKWYNLLVTQQISVGEAAAGGGEGTQGPQDPQDPQPQSRTSSSPRLGCAESGPELDPTGTHPGLPTTQNSPALGGVLKSQTAFTFTLIVWIQPPTLTESWSDVFASIPCKHTGEEGTIGE